MQHRGPVPQSIPNQRTDAFNGLMGLIVVLYQLVRLFLHHLLGQVGNIVKMIVKGVPVYAAPLHNVLDGDFVHRLLTQKLYKRIHNRTACPFHRKASFSWSFGKSRRQLCPRTDITFLGHKNIILAPSEKCNQKTTPFSDAVFKERSYVL